MLDLHPSLRRAGAAPVPPTGIESRTRPVRVRAAITVFAFLVAACGGAATSPAVSPGAEVSAAVSAAATVAGQASADASSASSEWVAVTGDTFAGAVLSDVATFANGFVTVGSAPAVGEQAFGGIWTSTDAESWTAAGPATTFADAVVAAAGGFGDGILAIGAPCAGECFGFESWSTADGQAWSGPMKVTGADSMSPTAFAAQGQLAVAVGDDLVDVSNGRYNGRVFTTTDGKVWTAIPDIEAMHDARLSAIAAGTSGFVIVGSLTTSAGRSAAAWSSPDGTTWTRAADDPSFASATLSSVAQGGPGYVAVGSDGPDGAVWTSTDGMDWSRIDDAATFAGSPLVDVAANANGFIAIGSNDAGGTAWTSADGIAWTAMPAIPGSEGVHFKSVAIGLTSSVIVGRPGPSAPAAGLVWFGPAP